VDAGLLGKLDLSPVPGAAQLPNPLPSPHRCLLQCVHNRIGLCAIFSASTLLREREPHEPHFGVSAARLLRRLSVSV
jgi:hypothetical protein